MSDKKNKPENQEELFVTRRSFMTLAGTTSAMAGASLVFGKPLDAFGKESTNIPAHNSSHPFDPKATTPTYPPRELPKPGDKIHEFEIDLRVSCHEIVPGVQMHAFTYNGSYPGPEI